MDNIQYDPERILHGLPEDVLKELAKKLKRRIRQNKNEIIQEILSPPKGKPEARVRIWQEINRQLRKELETFAEEKSMSFSSENLSREEQFKFGYMLTLSTDPEIRTMGEELYCLAEQNYDPNLNKEDHVEFSADTCTDTIEKTDTRVEKDPLEVEKAEKVLELIGEEEMKETRDAEEKTDDEHTELMKEAKEEEEMREAGEAGETKDNREAEAAKDAADTEKMIDAKAAEVLVEARDPKEIVEIIESEEMKNEVEPAELLLTKVAEATIEARNSEEATEAREAEKMMELSQAAKTTEVVCGPRVHTKEEQISEENEELHRKIKTLENKLRKATAEGLRTKGQLEKLKTEMAALKSQWVREKEETGKYRNRVKELEEERSEKDKEIEALKQKVEQKKTVSLPKTKEQPQRRELPKVKSESGGEIDLALYQGRKALIFAERDNELDIRLNALGIIPIWAMEIDWNRPRRRMSTCEVVLYKMNDQKLKKIDEIRDIARYWNIPCNELLNI